MIDLNDFIVKNGKKYYHCWCSNEECSKDRGYIRKDRADCLCRECGTKIGAKKREDEQKETKRCLRCGEPFIAKGCNSDRQKYCSHYCFRRHRDEAQRIYPDTSIKKCLLCGNDFEDSTSNKNKKFCCKEHAKKYRRLMWQTPEDINHKLKDLIYSRLKKAIKYSCPIAELGCSIAEFRAYIEKQFYDNPDTGEPMTWVNRGYYGWHVDHIKPLGSFDLNILEQFKQANHYTNLRPLWHSDHKVKTAKDIKDIKQSKSHIF